MRQDVFPPEYPKERCQLQALALVKAHNVRSYISSRAYEWVSHIRNPRIIVGPRLTSDVAYAVWLHELGHVLHCTKDEAAAWQWARGAALFWSGRMERLLLRSRDSYVLRRHPAGPPCRFRNLDDIPALCNLWR